MSAATAPNPKSGEAKTHEPSMEEILASIRRIIADDQALPLTPRPSVNLRPVSAEPSPAAEPPRRATRLPLQPSADAAEFLSQLAVTLPNAKAASAPSIAPAPQPPAGAKAEPMASEPEVGASAWELRPTASIETDDELVAPAHEIEAEALALPETGDGAPPAEVASTFMPQAISTMPSAVSPREGKLLSPAADASVATSFNVLATTMFIQNSGAIEQAVREMLRPMLQRWLDDNLPTMVERLVRVEIERVARGGRG